MILNVIIYIYWTDASLPLSVLKKILGDASRAHRLLHDKVGHSTVLMLCMLSIACPNV